MAWGRLLQLGKPLTRSSISEFTPVWWRSFSSFPQSAMETFESGAQVTRSSNGDGLDAVTCGRGDKKTKRGKRFKGSFGNPREQRGTTTRRLRKNWQLSYDPLLPVHAQPFPPVLAQYSQFLISESGNSSSECTHDIPSSLNCLVKTSTQMTKNSVRAIVQRYFGSPRECHGLFEEFRWELKP